MSDNKTVPKGYSFWWEPMAQRGEDMPTGMDYPDQVAYQSLALLYARHKLKAISREQAQKEKAIILDEYEAYKRTWAMAEEWSDIIRLPEIARAEFRKNPTIETGYKLVEIIEGRKK